MSTAQTSNPPTNSGEDHKSCSSSVPTAEAKSIDELERSSECAAECSASSLQFDTIDVSDEQIQRLSRSFLVSS